MENTHNSQTNKTLEQWVQRQQFLSAVEGAQNWLAMLRYHAVRYNWPETTILLALADNICHDLRNTAPERYSQKGR
ncbi:hypothetical protein M6E18_004112 [Salmonella enterica]|nr:hypothetical protein [Salmonella enterica]EHO3786311.1 hypothetical protein [Salmonella enterica]EJF0330064.1 hypothetical protein [Salmonella enterica]